MKLPLMIIALTLIVPTLIVGYSGAQTASGLEFGGLIVDTRIENHYAMTTFTGHISNPSEAADDMTFRIEVPDDAMLTNLSITIDGTTSYATIAPKSEAQQDYDDATASGKTATQLRATSEPTIFNMDLNIRANSTISFSIRYEQILVKKMHNYTYNVGFDTISISNLFSNIDSLIDIKGIGNITPVDIGKGTITPTEAWITSDNVRYTYHSTQIDPSGSIEIVYQEEAPPIDGTLGTYIDDTGGYFMHVFSPQLEDLGNYLPKDIIFVLDKSGSMGGGATENTKMDQLKDAFTEIVSQVHDEDRFNIISFSSSTDHWQVEMVQANTDYKESSVNYIQTLDPVGSTNIDQALTDALRMFEGDIEAVPIIVFLTDGLPTTGEVRPNMIRENILYENDQFVSIYSLGFGGDVDFEFLSALSLENRGFAVKIPESEDASDMMQGFYETISIPLLQNIYFNYTGGAQEVIPDYMPSMFAGSEAVVVGKFDRSRDSITSTVSGLTSTGQRVFEESWRVNQDSEMEFIPRLWAHRMILHYMDQMIVEGQTEYLQQKVIDLALDYSFVTPFTSFILVINDPKEAEEPIEQPINDDRDAEGNGVEDEDNLPPPSWPGSVDDDAAPSLGDDDDDWTPYDSDDGDEEKSLAPSMDSDFPWIFILLVFIVIPIVIGLIIFGYSRIRREDLLNQENRKKIYEFITNNPGEHFRALQRAVDLEVGVLSHHLNVLEKEQLIVSEQDGNNRCFWAAGVKHDTDKVRLSRIQENILKEIQEDPGITQSQIARKMGVSRKVIFYHVKFLRNSGVVREEKVQRNAHYYERE
jgi:predicted transcriptional regulator